MILISGFWVRIVWSAWRVRIYYQAYANLLMQSESVTCPLLTWALRRIFLFAAVVQEFYSKTLPTYISTFDFISESSSNQIYWKVGKVSCKSSFQQFAQSKSISHKPCPFLCMVRTCTRACFHHFCSIFVPKIKNVPNFSMSIKTSSKVSVNILQTKGNKFFSDNFALRSLIGPQLANWIIGSNFQNWVECQKLSGMSWNAEKMCF